MRRRYDHIDLRVRSLPEARVLYEALLPALGFTRRMEVDGWLQFEADGGAGGSTEFFGVTEARGHIANECRIAFWAETTDEVDRLAHIVVQKGGRQIEGPGYLDSLQPAKGSLWFSLHERTRSSVGFLMSKRGVNSLAVGGKIDCGCRCLRASLVRRESKMMTRESPWLTRSLRKRRGELLTPDFPSERWRRSSCPT